MGIYVQSTRKIDGFPGNFGYTEKKSASMSKAVVSGPGRKRSQPEERNREESPRQMRKYRMEGTWMEDNKKGLLESISRNPF